MIAHLDAKKCLIGLATLAVSGTAVYTASAQEAVPAQPPLTTRSETVTEKTGPSPAMLGSGVVTLGVTYGAAAVVAATSGLDADHRMFVPIVGPWMALPNRGPCGGAGQMSCDTATTDKVLVVADGVGQALGALMIVEAFLNPETRTVTRATNSDQEPTMQLAPAALGNGGYGVMALGRF